MIRTVALFGKVKNPPKYTISPQLSKILNSEVITRPEALKQMWVYIKAHNLQDPTNKREIIADYNLKEVFGKDRATMFELLSLMQPHFHHKI